MQEEPKQQLTTPMAIVIAAIFIAGIVYFTHGKVPPPQAKYASHSLGLFQQAQNQAQPADTSASLDVVIPVTPLDHIRGSLGAKVTIIEYSDTECPFCKSFHATMKLVMADYNKNGTNEIAWVYRHFPIDSRHPRARKEAEALECANKLGGNDAFWAYTDRIYDVTPSNNGLDPIALPSIAKFVGLDVTKFNACLASGVYASHVASDLANAQATGGPGTPWSIIVTSSGKKTTVDGAEPYDTLKQMIDTALAQ